MPDALPTAGEGPGFRLLGMMSKSIECRQEVRRPMPPLPSQATAGAAVFGLCRLFSPFFSSVSSEEASSSKPSHRRSAGQTRQAQGELSSRRSPRRQPRRLPARPRIPADARSGPAPATRVCDHATLDGDFVSPGTTWFHFGGRPDEALRRQLSRTPPGAPGQVQGPDQNSSRGTSGQVVGPTVKGEPPHVRLDRSPERRTEHPLVHQPEAPAREDYSVAAPPQNTRTTNRESL